jgi:hypothetical protein
MSGLLNNDPTDDGSGGYDPGSLLSLLAAQSVPAGGAPPDVTIAPTSTTPPGATMADSGGAGGGFWQDLASGIGEAGLALGGGIDPSITGPARSIAGQRALLSFGLNMLANSGPSYTPRNFGQILATGLEGASESNVQTEQNRIKAQQIAATYALKAGQMKIAEYLAAAKGGKGFQGMAEKQAVSNLAGGIGGTATAPGTTTPPAASPGEFVTSNAPVFQDVAQRTGLPVEFVAGQAGNESGWGTSPAATQGNNLFGLSDASGKPLAFPTRQAGVDAYVNLLNTKYADVPRTGSAADIGTALGKAGYNRAAPDYGARIGGAAAVAAPLLPQPTTTGPTGAAAPGSMAPAPAATAGAPSGGAIAPTPSSTPPSLGAAVFGPGSPGWQTLPPAVLPDVAARKAEIEDTYQRDKQVAAASGDANLLQKANQDRQASLTALNKQVTDAQAAHQQAEIDLNAKQVEQAKTIAAEAARAAAEQAHAVTLAKVNAGYTAQQHQTDADQQVGSKQLEAMGAQAQKAETIQPMIQGLIPLLKNAPSGSVGQLLQGHSDWIDALASAGIIKPETQTAAQLINGLTDYLSLDLKPTATGALRTQEIPLLKGLGPQLSQSPQAQQQAAARVLNYTQRVKDEYDLARQNFGAIDPTTGQPNYKILYKNIDAPMVLDDNGLRVGGGLGSVVPEPPPMPANPTAADVKAAQRYTRFVANLPAGMPYNTYQKQPDGSYQRVLKVQQ